MQSDPRTTWPHLATCSNCGNALTADQVELAIDDAHLDSEEMDKMMLCCPSYNGESCTGMHDDDDCAYWYVR